MVDTEKRRGHGSAPGPVRRRGDRPSDAALVSYLNRHGVALFGWYRLALCALLGILIWQGAVPSLGG